MVKDMQYFEFTDEVDAFSYTDKKSGKRVTVYKQTALIVSPRKGQRDLVSEAKIRIEGPERANPPGLYVLAHGLKPDPRFGALELNSYEVEFQPLAEAVREMAGDIELKEVA
jgi:hypothetical protein